MADSSDKTESENKPDGSSMDLIGKTLGEFEISRRLGAGGMGEVYLARQKSLKRDVAIKVLRPDLAANETALKRFQAEAEAVARLNHPNIVQVYAIGEENGLNYMALEYVDGKNLREYLSRKGTPDLPQAINLMKQIASALSRASEMGFVHRDIKPENILLGRKGEVKIADFGLSRCFADEEQVNITRTGTTMGTPLYMSPEQVQGKTVDPRSDIYSFGVTSYHMLKGEPPFRGATAFEVALQHVQNEAPSLAEARPDLPRELCAIVHKMIAKKPEDRYQTAREIIRELNRIREGMPQSSPLVGNSNSTQPVYSGATQVVTSPAGGMDIELVPVSSRPRWLYPLAGLVAATGLGFALNMVFANTPVTVVEKETPIVLEPAVSANQKRIEELQAHIEDKSLKLEVVIDDMLELIFCMTREKQFDQAMKFFEDAELRKRSSFTSDSGSHYRVPKNQLIKLLSRLGKGIILSLKDESKASLKEFSEAMKIDFPPKALLKNDGPSPMATFLKENQIWKKAVADALERDVINLPPTERNIDPKFDAYRSYLPRMSITNPAPANKKQ